MIGEKNRITENEIQAFNRVSNEKKAGRELGGRTYDEMPVLKEVSF